MKDEGKEEAQGPRIKAQGLNKDFRYWIRVKAVAKRG